MKQKRAAALLLAAALAAGLLSGCVDGTKESISGDTASSASEGTFDLSFSARDLDVGYDESTAVKITLSGDSITVDGGGTSLDGSVLTISAERHSEHEDKDKKGKFVRCERSYGTYTRQFDVSNINTDAMKAKYENGVLTLNMPKKSAQLPTAKRVEIE